MGKKTYFDSIPLQPNKRIEHFEVIQELGEGAMGKVYKARDTLLDRDVALKTLSHTTEKSKERFIREAKALARLHHKNIVQIYEVSKSRIPYFAMEFVDGQDCSCLES